MCGKFGGFKRLKCLSMSSWRGDTILDRYWFEDNDSFVSISVPFCGLGQRVLNVPERRFG